MSLRTFTVFQDGPSSETSNSKTISISSSTHSVLGPKSSTVNQATTPTTIEKENVHPLTGERAGSSATNAKKRKTSVLATKVYVPLTHKKHKDSDEANPDVKKRKSSTTTAKGKVGVRKDAKSSGSSRKGTKKSSRKLSPMPQLEEEPEADKDRITQAEIDSRCYELTVQPLADVSQAYEQGASLVLSAEEENIKLRAVKAGSLEPEIRDYFSSPPQSAILPSNSTTALSAPSLEGRSFSTPERKKIYAAFTFTSPSPTGERYSKATRSSSIPRLELA